MSAVVIGSINCRGLSNNVKCCDIFNKCRDMYDISILVDTHSTKQREKQTFQSPAIITDELSNWFILNTNF
jgi:hypothetical protein